MADADAARETAREILAERRFREPELPRPFERPLEWLGDRVQEVADWFAARFDDVDGALPGGAWVVWFLLVGVAVFAGVMLGRAAVRRRAVALLVDRDRGEAGAVDPAALEREAEAAERAGEYELAVRLGFRAGVLRLERARVLDAGEARTTGEIAVVVGSPEFDALGHDFDAIAYGGRPAHEADARTARERWRAVLAR